MKIKLPYSCFNLKGILTLSLVFYYYATSAQITPIVPVVKTDTAISLITLPFDSSQLKQKAIRTIIEPEGTEQQPKMKVTGVMSSVYDVGEIPYTGGVTSGGAYALSIPIKVFPGINGLQPDLSLAYNSQAEHGIAGQGWNVSGLSSITRRQSLIYYDNKTDSLDINQAFPALSLDGQKLIMTSQTTDVIEFYPESDNTIKVMVNRAALNLFKSDVFRPESKSIIATVYYPNGNIAEYFAYFEGSTTRCSNANNLVFNISKITDANGNYMEYRYTYTTSNEILLYDIKYGFNSIQRTKDFATVKFNYRLRPDYSKKNYVAGLYIPYYSVIDNIQILYNGVEQRKYSFAYETPTGFTCLLKKISLSEQGKELPPVNLAYGTGAPDNAAQSTTEMLTKYTDMSYDRVITQAGRFAYYDESDEVVVYPLKNPWATVNYNNINALWGEYSPTDAILVHQYLNDANSLPQQLAAGEGFRALLTGNMDNSPEDELIKINAVGSNNGTEKLTIATYSPSVFGSLNKLKEVNYTLTSYYKQNNYSEVTPKQFLLGDFNGDGKNEIFAVEMGKFWQNAYPSTSACYIFDLESGSSTPSYIGFLINYKSGDVLLAGDYDGDGKTDIYHIGETGLRVYSFSCGNADYTQWKSYSLYQRTFLPDLKSSMLVPIDGKGRRMLFAGDINGDGKTDLLLSARIKKVAEGDYKGGSSTETTWLQCISTAMGFVVTNQTLPNCSIDGHTKLVDMNGDGQSDLVTVLNNKVTIYYSDGNTINASKTNTYTLTGTLNNKANIVVANLKEPDSKQYILGVYDKINKVKFSRNETDESRLSAITGSMGEKTAISYDHLDNAYNNTYTKGYGAQYPYVNFYGHMPVVTSVKTLLNNTVTSQEAYTYSNALVHKQGLGFCGFENVSMYNNVKNEYANRTYDPKRFGILLSEETGKTLQKSSWTVNVAANKQATIRLTKDEIYNKLSGQTATVDNEYDSYGNITQSVKTFEGGITETTTTSHNNITSGQWRLGLPVQITNKKQRNGQSWTTSATMAYDAAYRLQQQTDMVNSQQAGKTTFTYDVFGNVLTQSVNVYNSSNTRTNSYSYSTNGLFRATEINPRNQVTTNTYDTQGLLASVKDYKGNETKYLYDAHGRVNTVTQPDGRTTVTSWQWEDGVEAGSKYAVTTTPAGDAKSMVYYDAINREVRKKTQGFDGRWIVEDKEYNTKGELVRGSDPYTEGSGTKIWTTNTYDTDGRLKETTGGTGKKITYSYSGNDVSVTDGSITKTKRCDATGQTLSVTTPAGTISYTLRPDGQASSITAPGNAVTTMDYDSYGRQVKLTDPSGGALSYTYDADGNINKETDANGKSITSVFDTYGNITSKTMPEFTATYVYNTDGLLQSVTNTNGNSKTFLYDNLNRVTQCKEQTGSEYYQVNYTYANGKLQQVTHAPLNYTVQYVYNTYGYLYQLKDANNNVLYNIDKINERGQELQRTVYNNTLVENHDYDAYGFALGSKTTLNGLTLQQTTLVFDKLKGNLSSRTDAVRQLTENFQYDALNRLTGYGTTAKPQLITYNDNTGTIAQKTDAGVFQYGVSSRPHQVTAVIEDKTKAVLPQAMQTISYASFARPLQITTDPYTATLQYSDSYDRISMQLNNNGASQFTRYYFAGGQYEKTTTAAGGVQELLYLDGSPYSAGIVLEKNNGVTRLLHITRDHLGSITLLTDIQAKKQVAEYSYDAWGRLRNPADWDVYAAGSEPALLLNRGYTGHEHLPQFELINMNARLYDPITGTLLSPDNYVQAPADPLNYNRYSYARNNPLVYTDKDGNFIFTIFNGLRDLVNVIFTKGGLEFWNAGSGYFKEAWSSKNWHCTINSWKIDKGLFMTDNSKTFMGQVWEVFSRFTWQSPQSIVVGYSISHIKNFAGRVKSVSYYGGATVVQSYKDKWGAFTLGNYINGDRSIEADPGNSLFQHEYGHYLQSQAVGPFYLGRYAIPSLISALKNSSTEHNLNAVEQDANVRAFKYFNNKYDGFNKWDNNSNRIVDMSYKLRPNLGTLLLGDIGGGIMNGLKFLNRQ